ncbi:hypothetical protein [Fluviicola sp.]|uniref:hypothetical protein n=1 Tax=Fluviicola sp. TaxID=1917219 RepID=UPI00261F4E4A|nr:hypothetical protein [Fluviicola sp.]
MDALEKLITLATALFTLSLVSERVINWFKLYFGQKGKQLLFFSSKEEDISKQSDDPVVNADRERKIVGLNITLCIIVALLMNANVFDLLSLKDPTEHFGWKDIVWKSGTSPLIVTILYSFIGCVLTGFCMSVGSKFWHDTLDMLLYAKNMRKKALENDPKGDAKQPDPVKKEE